MPRRLRIGLRPRLLAALLLTSAVTLAVAALALLSPLEHKLRVESERSLFTAVHATRADFDEIRIDPATRLPDREELEVLLGQLRHRSGGQVFVLAPTLEAVGRGAPVDLAVPTYYSQVRRALSTQRGIHTLTGNLFVLAEPIRIGGRPFALIVIKRLDYVSSAVGVVEGAFIEAAAAGLGIALILGIGLTTTLLRRLRQLRDAARELERHGPGTPIRVKPGQDEIGELARTLASMQSRLAHQEAALHAFVATASHELRTPLASLDGMLELIEDDLGADHLDLEDARERTARAREQSRRLSQLASDLLDLSRLDAGVSLRSEPVELSELARAVAAELELQATERQVRIDVHGTPGPVWVAADPGAVARIVRILLDNALRVAPTGSAIEVDVRGAAGRGADYPPDTPEVPAEPGRPGIVVRDRGPGVPPAERELIFERFRRGAGAVGQAGFGLGLAIGRELASRMGGRLELLVPSARAASPDGAAAISVSEPPSNGAREDSHDDRRGACFALWLPAAKMHDVPLSAVSGGSAGATPEELAHTRS